MSLLLTLGSILQHLVIGLVISLVIYFLVIIPVKKLLSILFGDLDHFIYSCDARILFDPFDPSELVYLARHAEDEGVRSHAATILRDLLGRIVYTAVSPASLRQIGLERDDIIQAAMVRILRGEEVSVTKAYLHAIVKHTIVDEIRQARSRRRHQLSSLDDAMNTGALAAEDAFTAVARRLAPERLKDELHRFLPPVQADIVLRRSDGAEYSEIAYGLNISESNARQLHSRAIRRLRKEQFGMRGN